MTAIKQLEDKILELQKELELLKNPPSYKRWRAREGETYYFLGDDGLSYDAEDFLGKMANFRYDFGNYYKTEEEAEKARDKQLAIIKINDRINELNEGWEHNNKGKRFCIYHKWGVYVVGILTTDGYVTPFILNLCKTEEIANKIIIEHCKELNLIFNLK